MAQLSTHHSSKILVILASLLFFLFSFSSCAYHVNLPHAANYPTQSQLVPKDAFQKLRKEANQQIQRLQTQIWKQLAQNWGIKKLWGKFYLHVFFRNGRPEQCELKRLEVDGRAIVTSPTWHHLFKHKYQIYPQKEKSKKGMRRVYKPNVKTKTHKKSKRHRNSELRKKWKQEFEQRITPCDLVTRYSWKFSQQDSFDVHFLLQRSKKELKGFSPPNPRTKPPSSKPI